MVDFFKRLFNSSDFMPHGHCYMWHKDVLWLNVVGDGFIALAYYSIPFLLWWIVRKRKDLPFHGVYLMFALFILACGTTHLMEIVNIWDPQYRVSGLVKAVTALSSIGTAAMLYTLVPSIMAIPSQAQLSDANVQLHGANDELQRANERLQREIEERKKIEQALRQREESLLFFREMVNNASDAIIVTDGNFVITDWNKGAEDLFGYDQDEVRGAAVGAILQTEFAPGVKLDEVIADTHAKGFWKGEVRQRRKDGSAVPLLASTAQVRDKSGGVIGYISVNHDISIRKEAERKLDEAVEALERSNADLQQFAFVASHDLKEPLRKIQTFADRILDGEASRLSDKGRDYFTRMQAAAARMETLIDDLLTYATTTDNNHPRTEIDLNRVLDDVRNDLHNLIESTRATVVSHILPRMHGVPVQLRQLFQNLIANAIKFRKPDTPPRVEIECRMLETNGVADRFELTFRDNGIGFDEAHSERIFQLFQRLHGRERYGGSGIGLAVCKRVAENHGGSITANGRPGIGASFKVILSEV